LNPANNRNNEVTTGEISEGEPKRKGGMLGKLFGKDRKQQR